MSYHLPAYDNEPRPPRRRARLVAALLAGATIGAVALTAIGTADAQARGPIWDSCGRAAGWQVWTNLDWSSCGGSRPVLRAIRPRLHGLYTGKRVSAYVPALGTRNVCRVRRIVYDYRTAYVQHAWREVVVYAWEVTCHTRGYRPAEDQFVKRAGWRIA